MKTNLLTAAIITSALFIVSCGQINSDSSSEGEAMEMMSVDEMKTPTTLAIKIEGMSCPAGCAAPIQKDCAKLAGMGVSKVNFDEGMGYFTFDASLLSQEDILKCISNTNGGGIYTGTVVDDDSEVETDEATTEEAVLEVKKVDEAHS